MLFYEQYVNNTWKETLNKSANWTEFLELKWEPKPVELSIHLFEPPPPQKKKTKKTQKKPTTTKQTKTRQIWGIWKLRPAYSQETPNLGQNRWYLSRVTLEFDGWPCKTIGHLSFAVSSFVQHFIAIGEFKLELLSGNAQFGWNSTIFRAVWPWNLTYDLEKQ